MGGFGCLTRPDTDPLPLCFARACVAFLCFAAAGITSPISSSISFRLFCRDRNRFSYRRLILYSLWHKRGFLLPSLRCPYLRNLRRCVRPFFSACSCNLF